MTSAHMPKDGDFASFLQAKTDSPAAVLAVEVPAENLSEAPSELDNLPELTDEELERQALNDPGADGDTSTPE